MMLRSAGNIIAAKLQQRNAISTVYSISVPKNLEIEFSQKLSENNKMMKTLTGNYIWRLKGRVIKKIGIIFNFLCYSPKHASGEMCMLYKYCYSNFDYICEEIYLLIGIGFNKIILINANFHWMTADIINKINYNFVIQ